MTLASFAMLLFVVLLLLFSVLKADTSVKCVNESYSGTVFKPSIDGVEGRYDVEWCTIGNANTTEWKLVLSYNLAKNEKNCNKRTQPAQKHSEFSYYFAPDVNCTHMCFTTTLDMVFSGCFVLENWLPAMGSRRHFLGQYITNHYTRESFIDNSINADAFTHEKYVAVHWHLGNVVASTYDMRLCSVNHTTTDEAQKTYGCKGINDNCTITENNPHEIVCILSDLNGAYLMKLKHNAPWTSGGVFNHQVFSHYPFEVTQGRVSLSPAGSLSPALLCGALALALGALGAAALAVWRARARRRLRRAVRDNWRKPEPEPTPPAGGAARVLLLYAREGEPGAPLLRALRALLRAAGAQVLDLYSPEVVSVSAAAPGAWLRAALESSDVRVLLLQTPALAAMYGERAVPLDAAAAAALLRPRVVQAEPSPSDALLSMALRMLAEDVHTATPYNKYFLATLDSLETDTLPYIVPFRRYGVPADAARLALDVAPRAAPRAALHALQLAAHAFVQHVRAHPDYLKDHLLVLE